MPHPSRLAVAVAALLTLAGCTFQHNDLLAGASQQSEFFYWGRPAIGQYLCLSVEPGVPVTLEARGSEVIGYTRDVVAFSGRQEGNYIRTIYYSGALGWIDGLKIRPYHGPRPDSSCIIPGLDQQHRPIFVIR